MSVKDFDRLKKDIASGSFAPVYLFTGDNVYLKQEYIAKIKEALNPDDFNFQKEDGSSCDMASLICLANTAPVFNPTRLIVLNNADKLKKNSNALKALCAYLENPCPTTCFIVLHNDSKKSKKDKTLENSLSDLGVLIDFTDLKGLALNSWINEKAKEAGFSFEQEALFALVDLTGGNMQAIKTELDKLFLYKQSSASKKIMQEEVLSSIGFNKEENPYALSNAIMDGNKALALSVVDNMLKEGQTPVSLLTQITMCTEKMFRIKHLVNAGLSSSEIVESAGLFPWESRLVSKAGFMPSEQTLLKTLDRIIEADMGFKSSSLNEPSIVLKGILISLFSR